MTRMTTIKTVLAVATACLFAGDALAQSQGPLTTVPWAARSRTKPNPDSQTIQSPQEPAKEADALLVAPSTNTAKPVVGAPEPPKPQAAKNN